MNKEPKYKELTFGNYRELKDFLIDTAAYRIVLEDRGQDLQSMHIDRDGEILHCDFNANIYNGRFVNIDKLTIGKAIEILNSTGNCWDMLAGLVIEEVII